MVTEYIPFHRVIITYILLIIFNGFLPYGSIIIGYNKTFATTRNIYFTLFF